MSLLKRFSMSLTERMSNNTAMDQSDGALGSRIAPTASFNDFSMHIGDEVDTHQDHARETIDRESAAQDIKSPRRSFDVRYPTFNVGSAPAGIAPIATRSHSMIVPKSSVAHILGRTDPNGTPRSSLDVPASTNSTPRASFSSDDGAPGSPRSPQSPGSRRRSRQQKIHGMDYYEFCELVRAGSL